MRLENYISYEICNAAVLEETNELDKVLILYLEYFILLSQTI